MKKLKVYIASPYTIGDSAVNVKRQIDAFDELLTRGFIPFAPLMSHFQHMVYPRNYEEWMEWDFEWVEACDCLLRLSGESLGADREIEHAKKHGIPVFYSIDQLQSFSQSCIQFSETLAIWETWDGAAWVDAAWVEASVLNKP